jgi:hypothetical protein
MRRYDSEGVKLIELGNNFFLPSMSYICHSGRSAGISSGIKVLLT